MQCASILYPHTHQIWCFKPTLSAAPPPQQPPQQQGTSHHDKPKLITSPSNPFVKHCLKLRNSSSYRRAHASALVVGATPIRSHAFLLLFSEFSFSGFPFGGLRYFGSDPFMIFLKKRNLYWLHMVFKLHGLPNSNLWKKLN